MLSRDFSVQNTSEHPGPAFVVVQAACCSDSVPMRNFASLLALLMAALAGCRAHDPAAPVAAPMTVTPAVPPEPATTSATVPPSAPEPPPQDLAPDEVPAPAPTTTAAPESPPAPAPPAPPAIERFVGVFAYAGGEAQRKAAHAAIDAALADLDLISRSLARRKLAERDPVVPTITIEFAGGKATIIRRDTSIRTTLDGPAVTVTRDGRSAKVKHHLASASKLVETVHGERGSTTNTFVLSDDGARLTASTTIEGDRLKTPIRYRLSYRRR